MKVMVRATELYPVVDLTTEDEDEFMPGSECHEIPDDLVARYKEAEKKMHAAHVELADYLREHDIEW